MNNLYLEIDHKLNVEGVSYQKRITSEEIATKMSNYKLNTPSIPLICEYIETQFNKKSDFYYNYIQEKDITSLKVLIQVLYEQIESLCVDLAIIENKGSNTLDLKQNICNKNNNELNKMKNRHFDIEYCMKKVEEIKGNETDGLKSEIDELVSQCQQYEQQVKRKSELINRLFSDRSLFVKSTENLTGLLTRNYQFFMRYLRDVSDVYTKEVLNIQQPNSFIAAESAQKQAEKLAEDLSSMSKFLYWAKDYENTDDMKFYNDDDWKERKQLEKQEYSKTFDDRKMGEDDRNFKDLLDHAGQSQNLIKEQRVKITNQMEDITFKDKKLEKQDQYLQKRLKEKDVETAKSLEKIESQQNRLLDYDHKGDELKEKLVKYESLENMKIFGGDKGNYQEALSILDAIMEYGADCVDEDQIQQLQEYNPRMKMLIKGIKDKVCFFNKRNLG